MKKRTHPVEFNQPTAKSKSVAKRLAVQGKPTAVSAKSKGGRPAKFNAQGLPPEPTDNDKKSNGKGKGRPTKFTPATIDKLRKNISEGLPYELACRLSGIAYETYRSWCRDAMKEDADIELVNFLNVISKAESEAEATLVSHWLTKTRGDWRAAKEYLARRWPDRWGPLERHVHSGPGGGPIPVHGTFIVVNGTPDEYINALRQARAAITDGNEEEQDPSYIEHEE